MPIRTRLTAALTCALALCVLVSSAASARLLLGVGDESASAFSNTYLQALHNKRTRLIISYDQVLHPHSALTAYMSAARAAHQQVVVAFNPGVSSKCPARPCSLPSTAGYQKAFTAFHKAFPSVTIIQPWNEDNNYVEPTYRHPEAVVAYYRIVTKICRGCTVLGGDIEDLSTGPGIPEGTYIKQLLAAYRKAHVRTPQIWGVHNYVDVNYRKSSGTKLALKLLPGQIWLTETGGIYSFQTAGGQVKLKPSLSRQAASTDYLIKLALSSRRIARVYIYDLEYSAKNRFDSSLLGPTGAPRTAYYKLLAHYLKYFG